MVSNRQIELYKYILQSRIMMKKITIVLIMIFVIVGCNGNKRTQEMYADKQNTLRANQLEMLQTQAVMAEACKADSNPGLCLGNLANISKFTEIITSISGGGNAIPRLGNPVADVFKTVLTVGAQVYSGKVNSDQVIAGYEAIRDTATGIAGENSSINVTGDYIADNSGRINSDDAIDNSDNSHDNGDNRDNDYSHDNGDNRDNNNGDNRDNNNGDNRDNDYSHDNGDDNSTEDPGGL